MAALRYTDQQIFNALRAVNNSGKNGLSAAKYNQMRTSMQPSSALIIQRFGSWNSALKAAGLTPAAANRTYERKYQLSEVVEWVRRYLATADQPSYQDFSEWLKSQHSAPAAQTCRNIGGSWQQLVNLAKA